MKCGIVLAAGRSRRMGTHKLLLPFRGGTVVSHVVGELARSALARIFLVAGFEGERVARAVRDLGVTVVTNPDPSLGMLSSVRCGLRALPAGCEAALVALGDQPAVTGTLVDRMLRAFDERGKGIVVPVHEGRRGHPLLFSSRYFAEVLERYDAEGLRGLVGARAEDVLELEAGTEAVLFDMDTREDYLRERSRGSGAGENQ